MLTIRLRRKGKKNQPFFRVIVVDKRRSSTGGHAVEIVGNIDPLTKKKNLDKDRILYWISKGAKPSDTVQNLLISEKIIDAKKIDVSKKSKKAAEGEPKPAEATPAPAASEAKPAAETAQTQEAPAAVPAEATKEEPKQTEAPKEEAKPEEKPAEEPKPAA